MYFYVNIFIMKFSRKTIGLLISIVEWYDFAIYAMFIKEISKSFFSNYSGQYAAWYSFSILSIAYLFRPIGAYIFGKISEKADENTSLQLSLFVMAVSSLLVCVVPENSIIGIAILICVRILQGLAMGGCYGTSYVYVVSNVSERKNYAASFVCIGFIIGFLLGQMMNVLLTIYASNTLFAKYGWRLAFMLGALMSLLVVQLIGYRRDKNSDENDDFVTDNDVSLEQLHADNTHESDTNDNEIHFDGFLYNKNKYVENMTNKAISEQIEREKANNANKMAIDSAQSSICKSIYDQCRYLIHFFNSMLVGGLDILGFYLIFIYNPYLVQKILHMSDIYITVYNVCLLLLLWPIIVIFSHLSDQYGERKVLLFSGVLFVCMLYMLPWYSLYTLLLMLIMLGACYGSLPVWMVERFKTRPTHVSLSFNLAAALFSVILSFLAPLATIYGIEIFKYALMLIAIVICLIIYMDNVRKCEF